MTKAQREKSYLKILYLPKLVYLDKKCKDISKIPKLSKIIKLSKLEVFFGSEWLQWYELIYKIIKMHCIGKCKTVSNSNFRAPNEQTKRQVNFKYSYIDFANL